MSQTREISDISGNVLIRDSSKQVVFIQSMYCINCFSVVNTEDVRTIAAFRLKTKK